MPSATPRSFFRKACMIEKESTKFDRQREEMVKRQIETRGITDQKVLAAMRKVPRHLFVSEALRDQAYGDFPLPIGDQQTISQPYIVAEMTQALQLSKNDRVLEIGTGSGYQTAILAQLCSRVYTVEVIPELTAAAHTLFEKLGYDNIETRVGNGYLGWPEHAPFDAIVLAAAPREIPPPLVEQLAPGGRLVVVDFERIPGVSRDWCLQHVRAGKEVFRTEAYLKTFHLHGAMDYVITGAYRHQPNFQRFLQRRNEELQARGFPVDLME